MPEISVIIPVYNKARYVEEAIESVLSQTFQDFEIVVVDDGSTDESPEVLKKYINHQKIVIYRQENKGCPAALNKGIMLSTGKYICWLSADDLWYENKLEMQVKEFRNDFHVELIYTDTSHIDENGNVIEKHVKSANKDMTLPMRIMGINGSSVMFKRYCTEKIGMFDEELRCSNDADMWYKFGKYFKMKRIPLPLIQSRQAGNNRLSNNQEVMVKYYSIYLVKNNLPLELGLMRLLGKDPRLAELNFTEGKKYLQKLKKNYYFYRMRTLLFKKGWYYFWVYIIPILDRKYELFKSNVLRAASFKKIFKKKSIIGLLQRREKTNHKHILFLYPHKPIATFEDVDRKLLVSNFITHSLCFPNSKDKKTLLRLFCEILWADVVISWFADWHSFYAVRICRFFKKKSIVITGGYDISSIPEIGYGIAANRPNHLYMVRSVLTMSDVLITNSLFAKRELFNNFNINKDKVCMIYHGFGIDLPEEDYEKIKEDIVLTVANINRANLLLKGLRTFVQAASHLSNMRFVLIGPDMDGSLQELKKIAPLNVEFLGGLYGKDLIDIYKRAKVYVQVSMIESFGCALAEAMLYECVPVVSREGALPEVVGECGFYISANNPKELALTIEKAYANPRLGNNARSWIVKRFDINTREKMLVDLVKDLSRKNK